MLENEKRLIRNRRSKAEIEVIKSEMFDLLKVENPMTVRQLFYRMTTQGVVEKNEKQYKGTIGRLATEMRLNGELPFDWFADNTRWMRKPTSYNSLEQCLNNTMQTYRLDLWQNQKDYIEIWCEKDAIVGSLFGVTSQYDVPLMVTKGFCSVSYAHEAARTFLYKNKPTYIYYLGDSDKAGKLIYEDLKGKLKMFAPSANIIFEKLAVTEQQIKDWKLPTRPEKDGKGGECTEVDAIPPTILRKIVKDAIEKHIDPHQLRQTQIQENAQRETVKGIIDYMNQYKTSGFMELAP